MSLHPDPPHPITVMASDGVALATYDFGAPASTTPGTTASAPAGGDETVPIVLAVHGFSSSAIDNWVHTGWVRDLGRAGFRVIAYDQRGHGASGKPHDPSAYSMAQLVADLETVVDTWMLDDVAYLGYSLGARVGWFAAMEIPQHIRRSVLGGLSDGDRLRGFDVEAARRHVADGSPIDDPLTAAYVGVAERNPANDLRALIALIEGMNGDAQPDPSEPPQQPILYATGTADPIIGLSRELAAASPRGEFVEIPGRDHFTAPPSGDFRRAGIAFLAG